MNSKETIYLRTYTTPVGTVRLAACGSDRLCMCDWVGSPLHHEALRRLTEGRTVITESDLPLLVRAVQELEEYFAGERRVFDIPLLLPEATDFRMDAWNALPDIPYATTVSYGRLAEIAGHPKAVRAVGTAIGSNILSIFLPCHRVIPSHGGTGNYRGTPEAKAYLLALERRHEPAR